MHNYVNPPQTPDTTHIPGYGYLMIVVSISYRVIKLKLYNVL
jgi:hypothetical protein